jgi:hypothetical protein
MDPLLLNHFFKQQGSRFERCFFPTEPPCPEKAIRAHSIQNNGVLDLLAEAGHVVMLQCKVDAKNGPIRFFDTVGRNKATTFTGLCSSHDNELFRPIDTQPLDLSNKQQLFLLAYRSVLRELTTKCWAAQLLQSGYEKLGELDYVDRTVPSEPGILANTAMIEAWGMFRHVCLYYEAQLQKDWARIKHAVLPLDGPPGDFACSGVFDLIGSSRTPGQIRDSACAALNVFPDGGCSVAVVSYPAIHHSSWAGPVADFAAATGYYQKYLISKLVLQHCENFVLKPSYYEQLSEKKKAALLSYFESNLSADKTDVDDEDLYLF